MLNNVIKYTLFYTYYIPIILHTYILYLLYSYYIRISLYVFWLRKRPSVKYVRNCRRWGVIQNAYSCVQGKVVSRLMCTCAFALSLFTFLSAFCLIVYCLKRLFFSSKINFCRKFFYIRLFL